MTIDGLLLLMTFIWGTNYALVKSAFRELDPQAFNALRLVLASALMTATSHVARRTGYLREASPLGLPHTLSHAPLRRRVPFAWLTRWRSFARTLHHIFHTPAPVTHADWVRLAWLGLVGHCLYQYLFVGGLARTSVANGALIVSSTPIVITFLTSVTGHERLGRLHWAGTLVSLAGIYMVVGGGAHVSSESLRGDVMLMGAVLCWALYTMGARPLMERHSPVGVTALSMLIGTVVYVPVAAPNLVRVDWAAVSGATWVKLVYSATFAICIAYTIWYAAVRAIGSARTSVYSNLIPIVAMTTAWVWLGEPLGSTKLLGAAAVLAGVAVARMRGFGRTMEGP
jgi:drug/metabolite transporter (DMT)-like permease